MSDSPPVGFSNMKYAKVLLISIVAIYLSINSLLWFFVGREAIKSNPDVLHYFQNNSIYHILFINEYAQMFQWFNSAFFIPFGVCGYFIIVRNIREISALRKEISRIQSAHRDNAVEPLEHLDNP
jgi:hypothetical protein